MTTPNPSSSTYNLSDPKTPIASGRLLALLTNIVEAIGEPTGITNYLCADAGLHVLRKRDYVEPPTGMPVWSPIEKMVQASQSNPATNTVTAKEYLTLLQNDADTMATTARTGAGRKSHQFLTCRDFYIAYKSGQSSPDKVATQLIERIQASQEVSPSLGAVWNWNKEKIIKQAQESTARYQNGAPLSIVDGVPIIVKDEIDIEGFETGVGTTFINKGCPAKEDAHLVTLLRRHGAIIIGKSTMHEIGLGVTNFNPSTTTPRNPYGPAHCTGGSSGGSGAAVGSGLCPIAIGCDGGGSVRIPSSFCGIYGLKPTQGRVSGHGEYPLAPTVAISGPMCATMEDLAIVYAIMAGPDNRDPYSLLQPQVVLPSPMKQPSADQKGQLQGLRIGIYRRWFEDVTHPEIAHVCYKMLDSLVKDHGAVLVDIEIPELFENGKGHNITIAGEMLSKIERDRKKLNYQSRLELALIKSLKIQDYVRAQQQRTRSIRYLETLFGHKENDPHHHAQYPCLGEAGVIDVIATPTIAGLPLKVHAGAESHGESNYLNNVKTMQFQMMANFTGIPGITAVAGYTEEKYKHHNGEEYETGLPIGIQFMSQWWDEKRLIHVANVCEQVLESRKQPKIWLGDYALL